MFINPSNPVNNTAGAAAVSVTQKKEKRKKSDRVAESRLGREYARVLHRALQMEGKNPEVIRQLQEALKSGQLDTLEAAIQTAQALIQYGI